MEDDNWFTVTQSRPYLYTIQERLDKIDPRFYTTYTNMYLIVGEHTAVLFDTGSGIGNLAQVVERLIDEHHLVVINSHNHFDHIGSNHQFQETHIHRLDFKKLMSPLSLEFLHGCNPEFESHFEKMDWKMRFATEHVPLIGNELLNLGGIELQVQHTPGHTPGSISMWTDRGDVFTGDTLHYGAVFLPSSDQLHYLDHSLSDIADILDQFPSPSIFPGHETIDLDRSLYTEFMEAYSSFSSYESEVDEFLQAEIYDLNKFTIIQPLEIE